VKKTAVKVFEFWSTAEFFLARDKHDAVQMWRVGSKLIALEPDEPREVAPAELVHGLTVAEWQRIGQSGMIARRG
jgi:hypothetical protein